MSHQTLIKHLEHPNKWHRQTAVRLLGKITEDNLRKKLIKWVNEKEDNSALGGLWALHQSNQLDEELCVQFLKHPYPGIRSWTIRFLGDNQSISESTAIELRQLAETEKELEVWSQIASTIQRIEPKKSLPVLGELLARAGNIQDPYLPLMYWWAIEKHCHKDINHILQLFEDSQIWSQPMIQREILPRLMRRFALRGGEQNFLTCAKLLSRANTDSQRKALMEGFEKAFEGGSLPNLPDSLITAIRDTGTASLLLRVRQSDPDAIKEASKRIASKKVPMPERINYVRAFGEINDESVLEPLLAIISGPVAPIIRRAAINACQRFTDDEIGEIIISSYPLMIAETQLTAQRVLSSRKNWSMKWMKAVEDDKIETKDTSEEAIAGLLRHQDKGLNLMVKKYFGNESLETIPAPVMIERIRSVIESGTGNPYRGRELYKKRCASCHVLFHGGGKVGPDLTSYQRDDLDTMLRSIIDPNAEIREGYESVFIQTKDGLNVSGFLADKGISTVTVRSFDGLDKTFQKIQIKSLNPLGRSLMPENLLNGLSDSQLRDFFAYLRSSQPFTTD